MVYYYNQIYKSLVSIEIVTMVASPKFLLRSLDLRQLEENLLVSLLILVPLLILFIDLVFILL